MEEVAVELGLEDLTMPSAMKDASVPLQVPRKF